MKVLPKFLVFNLEYFKVNFDFFEAKHILITGYIFLGVENGDSKSFKTWRFRASIMFNRAQNITFASYFCLWKIEIKIHLPFW